MNKLKRCFALVLVCLLITVCTHAEDTVTISMEEYALLQKYKQLEDIVSVIDEAYLWEYDKEALMDGAALGLLGALGDDYSFYYTATDMESEEEAISGEYGGLGLEVFGNPNDMLITVRRVFFESPAQKAGIRPGDKIVIINDEEMTAYDVSRAVQLMRGEIGGTVSLVIQREGELIEVECVRATIQTEIITSEIIEGDIGLICVHYFEGNAMGQFEEARKSFEEAGVKGLVIDLRGNPGGFIVLAVEMADIFLDDALVATTEDRYGRTLEYYAEDGRWDIPVVVLIDDHTASSAEILAAALHDHDVAKLVGEKSYGKGIVQTVFTFRESRSGMQLTTDYWLTPKGEKIHEKGIEPDIEVALSEDATDDNFMVIQEKDNQLSEAIKALREMIAAE